MQLSPIFNVPAFTDSNGNPLSGGRIYAYEAGSFSVLKGTFTSQSGDVPNSNPIILDSAGRLPAGVAIWLSPGELYNLVLTDAAQTVIQSFDEVTGVPVLSTGGGPDVSTIWVETPSAAYLSATSFLVPGNFSQQYSSGNRVRLTLATGFTYGTVQSSVFSSPNTSVTIINDGAVLNSSLSKAEYSVLVVNAETVDAGAVSYTPELPYSTANTVGNKLKTQDTQIGQIQAQLPSLNHPVYTATGSGVYSITPTIPVTSYSSNGHWVVRFVNAPAGAPPSPPTLSVSDLPSLLIKQYDSTGALVPAHISAGLVSEIAYDAGNNCFILLDQLPATPPTPETVVTPRGIQVFNSNGVFTVPPNVSFIKVTCVGGGGGGGAGSSTYGEESFNYYGGGGGGAATAIRYLPVTSGTTYSVAIGAGGTGGTTYGTAPSGGSTSFGVSLVTAAGGNGGVSSFASNGTGGTPGSGGTGDLVLHGFAGSMPTGGSTAQLSQHGRGGTGGFGTASVITANPGAPGNAGICVVEW